MDVQTTNKHLRPMENAARDIALDTQPRGGNRENIRRLMQAQHQFLVLLGIRIRFTQTSGYPKNYVQHQAF